MLWGGDGSGGFVDRVLDEAQDSGLSSRVWQWYNSVADDVASRRSWRHFERFALLKITAPYSTGTVDVTNGQAVVTGSGTDFATAVANQLFQGPDSIDYRIASRDSATQITLDRTYLGDTATGQAYKIIFWRVDPPTNLDFHQIENIVLQNAQGISSRVYNVSDNDMADWNPDWGRFQANRPYRYVYREGAMFLWPPPSSEAALEIKYKGTYTVLSKSTAVSYDLDADWPVALQEAILTGVQARAFEFMEQDRAVRFQNRFERKISYLAAKDGRGPDVGAEMRRYDDYRRRPFLLAGSLPRRFPGT